MTPLDKSRLTPDEQAWAELAEKATPEPWKWDGDVWEYDKEQEAPWLVGGESEMGVIYGEINMHKRDADFIIAARSAVPALIKSLALEREAKERVEESLSKAHRLWSLDTKKIQALEAELSNALKNLDSSEGRLRMAEAALAQSEADDKMHQEVLGEKLNDYIDRCKELEAAKRKAENAQASRDDDKMFGN
jgi:hypothetical protein